MKFVVTTSRLIACGAVLLALAGLTAAGALAKPMSRGGAWQVVLVAGDRAQPVFDNATRAMGAWLIGKGVPAANIRRFTASAKELAQDTGRAVKSVLLQQIAALPARRGDRCLLFLTSHGTRDRGVYLAADDTVLGPEELAHVLSQGCGRVPTVAIVSACYSGAFSAAAMERPNRIILTAARADRPSFGCQADRTYTFFDECLLGALPKAATWQALYEQSRTCVRQTEQRLNQTPSEPQAYFGTAVRKLSLQFRAGADRAGERMTRR